MNTINASVSGIPHRPQPQAATQNLHARRDDVEEAARPGRSAAEPEAKGVLRLLQEGHFKGVADVRLRINFHEQLQALDKAAAQETSGQALGAFDQAVADSIAQHPQAPQSVVEQLQGFQTSLQEIAASGDGAESMGDAVGAAFADLMAALRDFSKPESEDSPEEDVATVSGVADDTSPDGAVAAGPTDDGFDAEALMSQLETGFSDFEAALASTSETHEFTAPNGNGVAFDKFLDIYRAISTTEPAPGADEQANLLIDQTA